MGGRARIVGLGIVAALALVDGHEASADPLVSFTTSYVTLPGAMASSGYVGSLSGGYPVRADGSLDVVHATNLVVTNAGPSVFMWAAKQLTNGTPNGPVTIGPRVTLTTQVTTTTCTPDCVQSVVPIKKTWTTQAITYTNWVLESVGFNGTSTYLVLSPVGVASVGAVAHLPALVPDATPAAQAPSNTCQIALDGAPRASYPLSSLTLTASGHYAAAIPFQQTDSISAWATSHAGTNGTPSGTGKLRCVYAPSTTAGVTGSVWYSQWTLANVGATVTAGQSTTPITFRTITWSL